MLDIRNQQTITRFPDSEQAENLVLLHNSDPFDDWVYTTINNDDGTAQIAIYDEDNIFLGYL